MKQPADVLAADPLSDIARRERRALVAVSSVGLIMAKGGLVPSRITALGIEFDTTEQNVLVGVLVFAVLYFFVGFVIYASQDFALSRLAFFRAIDEASRQADPAQDAVVRKRKLFWIGAIRTSAIARSVLEFAVPLILALYALGVLLAFSPSANGQPQSEQGRKLELEHVVPADSLDQLIVTAQDVKSGVMQGTVYNGTNQKLNTIVFRVIVFQADGAPRWDRRFDVPVDISPMAAGSFVIDLGDREAATPMSGILWAAGEAPTREAPSIPVRSDWSSGAPRLLTYDEFQRIVQRVVVSAPAGMTRDELNDRLQLETESEETRLGISTKTKKQ